MARRVTISARAAREIQSAAAWWQANRPAAPGAIAADFGEAVALLAEQPGLGVRCDGARIAGVRRVFLARVGYFIYYVANADQLKVLAFWHASRDQRPAL
jgi:plasmid stabilization system protein ParE